MAASLTADLLVDTNRNGRIDPADNFGEDVWVGGKDGRGAIVLPNLDRDNQTTPAPDNWVGGNFNGLPVAPNNVIDNAADLSDIGLVRLAKLESDSIYNYRLTIRVSSRCLNQPGLPIPKRKIEFAFSCQPSNWPTATRQFKRMMLRS